MDAERQAVALGGGVDRPQVAAAERRLLHGEDEDLHEAPVLGATLDLIDRILGVLHRHHDRRPQARIAIADALARSRSIGYTLDGTLAAAPEKAGVRTFKLKRDNSLNPVPGLAGVLR